MKKLTKTAAVVSAVKNFKLQLDFLTVSQGSRRLIIPWSLPVTHQEAFAFMLQMLRVTDDLQTWPRDALDTPVISTDKKH